MMKQKNSGQSKRVKTGQFGPVLVGLFAFCVLFAGLGFWASNMKIAGAVVSEGVVAVKAKPKSIQHLDGGIVKNIYVSNGQYVEKNALLFRLDSALLQTNREIQRSRLREVSAARSRLKAESNGLQKIVWDNETLATQGILVDKEVRAGQEKLFKARINAREGQISRLGEQILQLGNQITGVQGLKRAKHAQVELLQQELESLKKLQEKGLVRISRVLELEREYENLIGQNSEHDAEIARLRNSIGEVEVQILQIERDVQEEVLAQRQELDLEANELIQQLGASEEQLQRVEIRAPVSGIIHALNIFTVGGIVPQGAEIAQIIPQNENLEVEAKIEPQFIDELFVGQEAVLRFSAFNQRHTPEIKGKLRTISANTIADEQTGASYYIVNVEVPEDELTLLGDQVLLPGMPAQTFLQTQERTPLEYILKPLSDQLMLAFREE